MQSRQFEVIFSHRGYSIVDYILARQLLVLTTARKCVAAHIRLVSTNAEDNVRR